MSLSKQMKMETIEAEGSHIIENTLDMMASLYERWQWEKQYEDWSEYEKVMKKKLDDLNMGASFIKATKRPFGFKVRMFNVPVQIGVVQKRPGVLVSFVQYDASRLI